MTIFCDRQLDPFSLYPLAMLETQLARALRLNLHFFGCQEANPEPQLRIFRCLAWHSSRWEELSLQLTSALFPLLCSLRGDVPSLRKIFIQWDGPKAQSGVDSTLDFLETAPSLIDVGIYNEYRFIPVSLPAQQLTRYQYDGPWKTHRDILKQARNLVEARISVQFNDSPFPPPQPSEIIELPCLSHAYLTTPRVFDYIQAPALDDLVLSVKERHESSIVGSLQSFINRSSCTIRRLCLSSFTAPSAIAILQAISSITELRIVVAEYDFQGVRTLLENLTVAEALGSAIVASQLRCISLGCPMRGDDMHLDYGLYLGMVKSRWKADHCALTKSAVFLHSGPGPDAVTRSGLDQLREEGMDLLLLVGEEASDVMDYWLCHARY
ncbi:hypothetical protein MVEN_01576300 [Mycena venus]|uniref:Uncharacterized protein n=1 Tax=Mycena venus TaxID=2733690 RepID=A0A8H6XSF3_9AGAR|nr:hypothetical protein MVEN_01576300 [Mycena venus]